MEPYTDYDDYAVDVPDGYDGSVDYPHYYDEEDPFREDMSFTELCEGCIKSNLTDASSQLIYVFLSCLVFKYLTRLFREPYCHIISVLCGLFNLYSLFGFEIIYTAIVAAATYFGLLLCVAKPFNEKTYKCVMIFFFSYLVLREYFQILPEQWDQVRGIQMIIVLKSLSVSYEITTGARASAPPILEYIGYIFCPPTVIFGPWITMNHYNKVYLRRPWSLGWVIKVFATILFSYVSLSVSSCFAPWLFASINSDWILAARDAISVRFSHYFVSFASEAMCTLSGFYGGTHDPTLNIDVTNPLKIEFPRSLSEVVIHWNIPMHKWLKIHVFRASQNIGMLGKVILTFLVSSLLHGLNFGLSMVLLSLGVYTFVEHTLREKLSSIFDACVRSRKCPSECQRHTHKSSNPGVFVANLFFSGLAYFHLAYLGVMMNSKPDEQISVFSDGGLSQHLQSWTRLGYLSPMVVLFTALFSVCI